MNIKTANRLCELRKSRGLSQEELADRLNVSRQAVSKWERGESSPDTDNLIELAKIYGVSIDELINGDEIPTQNSGANEKKRTARDGDDADEDDDEDDDDDDDEDEDDEDGVRAEVHIDDSGIHISKGNKKVEITDDGVKVDGEETAKETRFGHIIYSTYSIIVTIAYLLLGFLLPDGMGWTHFWFLFITIPVVGSIRECFRRRRLKSFNYPCFVTALFCALGMFFGIWHPAWVLFITIPIFYIVADTFRKK